MVLLAFLFSSWGKGLYQTFFWLSSLRYCCKLSKENESFIMWVLFSYISKRGSFLAEVEVEIFTWGSINKLELTVLYLFENILDCGILYVFGRM